MSRQKRVLMKETQRTYWQQQKGLESEFGRDNDSYCHVEFVAAASNLQVV